MYIKLYIEYRLCSGDLTPKISVLHLWLPCLVGLSTDRESSTTYCIIAMNISYALYGIVVQVVWWHGMEAYFFHFVSKYVNYCHCNRCRVLEIGTKVWMCINKRNGSAPSGSSNILDVSFMCSLLLKDKFVRFSEIGTHFTQFIL
jgi:hypothetical protein